MTRTINEVSTTGLKLLLEQKDTRIIDTRSVDAYNGWKFLNEARGGHIKNARSLPVKWTKYIDWIEMVRHKHLYPEHHLIVYGYSDEETDRVATSFLKSGYANLSVYNGFINEWSGNPELPMQYLERFTKLVPPKWVKMLISGSKPDYFDNDKFVIVHSHYRNRDAYLGGHIPGAIDMDTMALEEPETWNRRNPQELKKALEDHGITSDTTVIMYGKYMSPDNRDPFPGSAAGDIGALRCAFIMMYAGVKDVRVLNGGFQSWSDEGYEIAFDDKAKSPVPRFGAAIPVHPEFAVDTPEAKQILASTGAELVCVRSWPEFTGEVSGYNYIRKKGRIPGAVFADCGSDAYHMENYRNFYQTVREYHEIEESWNNRGITADKHLAFYCGTGWRGSEAWFNAWLMGWPRVSVYDGGWFEWSSDVNNPVETGIPGFGIRDFLVHENDFEIVSDILVGLSSPQKHISCRFFYDDAGSKLFEDITMLPEYYPARTEKSILKEAASKILDGTHIKNIVELGSGDCSKISILLESLSRKFLEEIVYIPVDLNKSTITNSAELLLKKIPGVRIRGVITDIMKDFKVITDDGTKLICFFGSTLGNLTRFNEMTFLQKITSWMNPGDQFLLGLDMVKDIGILEKAYNDEQGKTAAFNKNILNVVNHYAETNFDPTQFDHFSFYNLEEARIEMHLRAKEDIQVSSPHWDHKVLIRKGETIHSENSHKYDAGRIHQLAGLTGLKIKDIYTDVNQWFSLVHFQRE